MDELLRESIPRDDDLLDLIESAFLQGQLDGHEADLAYALVPKCGNLTEN